MKHFIVRGGRPLRGTVTVGGSKNAALPLLFATLLIRGKSVLENLPDITDIHIALDLMRELGARITYLARHTVEIDAEALTYHPHREELTRKIRASTYLLGAELARFGRSYLYDFGGCAFCARPIDMHIDAIRAFGGKIDGKEITAESLCACRVPFRKPSVGATVNALLLAATAEGECVIENPAVEPHVLTLVEFLRLAGADIVFRDGLFIVRGRELHGARMRLIPDDIEAGTYLMAGLCTGGAVTVRGVIPEHLTALLSILSSAGASILRSEDSLTVYAGEHLAPLRAVAAPYPSLATDLLPPLAAVLAVGSGGELHDTVFPHRFGYMEGFRSFGARYTALDGGVLIRPSTLRSASVSAPDLRGGAALVLLALSVVGESRVENADRILRGYEDFAQRLRALGADISEN